MQPRHARTLRDVIEIIAIVLAGAWALYVFVFQKVVVPGTEPPDVSFAVQMRHVGNDGPLAVVRIDETIKNVGTVRVHFLGYGLTVLGMRVVPLTRPLGAQMPGRELYAYSRFDGSRVVYRDAYVTALGDPKTSRDIVLQPGQQYTFTTASSSTRPASRASTRSTREMTRGSRERPPQSRSSI